MTLPTLVDYSPARVDYVGLTAGTPWTLVWGFGPVGVPDNLTGRLPVLYVQGSPVAVINGNALGTVTANFSALTTAAFSWGLGGYVLMLDGTPQVVGDLKIALRVTL